MVNPANGIAAALGSESGVDLEASHIDTVALGAEIQRTEDPTYRFYERTGEQNYDANGVEAPPGH